MRIVQNIRMAVVALMTLLVMLTAQSVSATAMQGCCPVSADSARGAIPQHDLVMHFQHTEQGSMMQDSSGTALEPMPLEQPCNIACCANVASFYELGLMTGTADVWVAPIKQYHSVAEILFSAAQNLHTPPPRTLLI